jgi:hypothetical protein
MKILHVAQDLEAARVRSRAIQAIAQNVTLAWAGTPAGALEWLRGNTDTAAVIVEVEAQSCAPFVREIRASRLHTPVVVVDGSARVDSAIDALNSGADGYLLAGDSIDRELPEIVVRAIDRAGDRAREQTEMAADLAEQRRRLARENRLCAALQQQSLQLERALTRLEKRRAEEAAAFADLLDARHRTFAEHLTEVSESRHALVAELVAATATLESERKARIADAEAAGAALADALAAAESTHETTRARAATDLADANARCAALEGLLAQEAQGRAELERTVAALCVAQEDSEQRHADELAAATAKLADLESRHNAALEEHAAIAEENAVACASYERSLDEAHADLAEAVHAHQRSEHRANRILAAALTREAELVEVLETESAAKAVAESHAAAARMDSARRRDRSLLVVSRYRRHVRAEQVELTTQLARERARADRERSAGDEMIARLTLEGESLRRQLDAQHEHVHDLHTTLQDERQAHELTRSSGESDLRGANADMERLQQSFDQLQAAFQQLDDVAGDHAATRLRLEALVADRDRLLAEETERHLVAEEDTQHAVAHLQERLRQAAEERHAEAARLQGAVDALRRELEVTRTDLERLRRIAERVPDLETQLEKSRHEKRRQFERAPYGLCRCSSEGTVIEANHSFVALLGYRRAEDLRNLSWLTVAKERTGDLGWLLERAQATRKAEAVETLWHTREGRRIVVRLQALATSSGVIDIVAEDVTTVRVLEERLRQAQKMEAVGRLASEVAVTCEALLGDVVRETGDWVDRAESAHLRMSANRMREELTRARGFMRSLGSYGDEQKRALEPVSAQGVLRELAPVLKRLVGERIELVLPKSAGVFPVDVDAERLERVLTNVAGYARERMPMGGQVTIDLATIAIGRRFAAGHANVRAGDHVLITVTELASAGAAQGDTPRRARSTDTAGMELGVLMELISSCGGHLWLEAQPAGSMVVKIHLPKPAVQADRGRRRLPRWLRAASAANLLA